MPSSQQLCDFLVVVTIGLCAYFLATAGTVTVKTVYIKSTEDLGGTAAAGSHHKPVVTTIDPNTGFAFDPTLDFSIAKKMQLLGVGTRKKAILNIYSVGIYASKPIVKQWESAKIPSKGPKRCETALLESKAPRAVQLKFSMGISAEKIAEAVSSIPGVASKIRQDFESLIVDGTGGKLKKNDQMTFEWKGFDQISVSVRGKSIGTIKDKTLAQGVLNLYVGSKSVAPSLLKDLQCL
jgi:Chalcone isomerase-like